MNIREIAQLAGVSSSTVSKVINRKDSSISSSTRKKILDVLREHPYSPYGREIISPRTWRIGVVLNSPISFDSTLDGIIQAAQAHGYTTMVFNSHHSLEEETKYLEILKNHSVDGIIWEPATETSMEHISTLELNSSFLTIGPFGGNQSLLLPYKEAAYKLAEVLYSLGHKTIGCLTNMGRRTNEFIEGYKEFLYDHHLPYSQNHIFSESTPRLLEKITDQSITGIISSHYRPSLELLQSASHLHYSIPQDISLVSIKNDTIEQLSFPNAPVISTYTIRNSDFGSYLCQKLIRVIEEKPEEVSSFVQEFSLDNHSTISSPPNSSTQQISVIGTFSMDTYHTVQSLPLPGTTVTPEKSVTVPGGSALNIAVGAAKLGATVSALGAVGYDTEADRILETLQSCHVNTSCIEKNHSLQTGESFTLVDISGESVTSFFPGANSSFTTEGITELDTLAENTGLYILNTGIPQELFASICKIATSHNTPVLVKAHDDATIIEAMHAHAHILITNESTLKATHSTGAALEEKAEELLTSGIHTLIITQANKGCTLFSKDKTIHYDAHSFNTVDTTGAGDAFTAAFAAYIAKGYSTEKAAEVANFAAGFSVTELGVLPSLIDIHMLNRMKQDPTPAARAA